MKYFFQTIAAFTIALSGCHESASSQSDMHKLYETDEFKSYWYSGKAEVAAYNLDQARYGENHTGKAVLIFVKEDFSKKKHVKLDDPNQAGRDKVSVLKMNFTKKFVTGIYPYSMMLSVFTPVDQDEFSHTLKVTMSSQEWCGHVYSQLNRNANHYAGKSYSYFEHEGDHEFSVKQVLLEDEVWNLIRLTPESLPEGRVEIIPGLFFTRLKHADLKSSVATATKETKETFTVYTLSFEDLKRKISIQYQNKFPHQITGWTEDFEDFNGNVMRTSATLDRALYIDYWNKNKKEFRHLRDSLNLPVDR
jgi:hypothetical protein